MILLQFKSGQQWHLGVKTEKGIVDVTAALNDTAISPSHARAPSSLADVCVGGTAVCEVLDGFVQHLFTSDPARR